MIVTWTALTILFDTIPFAVLSPVIYGAIESASSLAFIFGAVALFLFPATGAERRMRWVAFGLLILGIGGIVFNYVFAVSIDGGSIDDHLFAAILVRTCAIVLMAVGLLTSRSPLLTFHHAATVAVGLTLLLATATAFPGIRPELIQSSAQDPSQWSSHHLFRDFTLWHWLLSYIALALAILMIVRIFRSRDERLAPNWLGIALVLLAGSQVHNMLWPSLYSPVTTTADVLRTGFAATILFGALIQLRGIAVEREHYLAEARAYSDRLVQLNTLRADFLRMVVHEIGHPLAAIVRVADSAQNGAAQPAEHDWRIAAIRHEAELLRILVDDIHAAAAIEKELFQVRREPVALQSIIDDSLTFAATLPDLPVTVAGVTVDVGVLADVERIGQVMRNLLTNAREFTPPGTPVEIRVTRREAGMEVAVHDDGPGIHPNDLGRILEKFGRGMESGSPAKPGLGLGLYVSRRILQLHGTDIQVSSELGVGSTFSFVLELAA